jgi:hypothetical protein
MDLAELRRFEEIENQLRAWDWRADLKADERSIPWLARKTGAPQRTVYAYAYGEVRPPLSWLREAYRILKGLDE